MDSCALAPPAAAYAGKHSGSLTTAFRQTCPKPSRASCTLRPRFPGTTTTKVVASTAVSECNACLPGYGSSGSGIDSTAPLCTACTDGTYSLGLVPGGQNCTSCPPPPGYTGKMVSRRVRTWAGGSIGGGQLTCL